MLGIDSQHEVWSKGFLRASEKFRFEAISSSSSTPTSSVECGLGVSNGSDGKSTWQIEAAASFSILPRLNEAAASVKLQCLEHEAQRELSATLRTVLGTEDTTEVRIALCSVRRTILRSVG
jgi:hypothetical protein